jgi:hypothetical protein
MTTSTDDYEHAPLGDRQWHFSDIGYVYTDTHGRWGRTVAIIGAVGMSAATTRRLAALLLEAADSLDDRAEPGSI